MIFFKPCDATVSLRECVLYFQKLYLLEKGYLEKVPPCCYHSEKVLPLRPSDSGISGLKKTSPPTASKLSQDLQREELLWADLWVFLFQLSVSMKQVTFKLVASISNNYHHGSRVWICWAHLGSSFLMWYELWLQSSGGSTGLECPRGLTEGSTDLECPRWWQLELPKGWDFLWGCQSEHFDLPSYVIFKWLPWAFLKVW